ncbi:MAG: acetyl-CoA decarbonylase/synthase complex subunit delta, partial [Planctomycetota bacterium]
MAVQRLKEKWTHKVNTVTIGATQEEGGTRSGVVKIGGETTLPFLLDEGGMPNPPVVAVEVWDSDPGEAFPAPYREAWGDALKDPVAWTKQAEAIGAEAIVIRLAGAHPDNLNTPVEEVGKVVQSVREATGLPLVVWGTGNADKDNEIIPHCTQLLKGERALFASAVQDNYKRIAAACIADGHSVVSESPLDINICKQVNILLTEMELPADRIVIYPTNGALGYGFEYGYSIMERTRLAALGGDKMMAMPIAVLIGSECIRTKEVKASESEFPTWGGHEERAIGWEIASATGYLMAGADLLAMGHPKSVDKVKTYI